MPDKTMIKQSLKKWADNLKVPAKDQITELDKKESHHNPIQNEENIKKKMEDSDAPVAT